MAEHFWVGAVTHETATVKARIPTVEAATLEYDTDDEFTDPATSVGTLVADAVWTFELEGLAPATTYHYRIQGDHDDGGGSFTTFPAPGPASYRFAAASCGGALGGDYQVGSTRTTNSPEYERIAARHPLFFVHMGDLHYRDIATNDVSDHRAGYKAVLDPARAQTLWRAVPVMFSWDDHDRGPNNNNRTYSGRAAAEQAYREYVPHYPLPADVRDGGNGEVYQTWTVGRTRHILLDTRSERSPQSDTDNSSKTMLGADQKAWLKTTLLAATEPVIFLYVGVPWIAAPAASGDHWGGYATERAELAQFFHDHGLTDRLFLIHGDAHQLSYDDGTNSQYADTEEPGPHVAGCAPIDSSSSTKGGPYSQGTPVTATQQQSGLFEVVDAGSEITVTFHAWSGSSSAPAFTVAAAFAAPDGYAWGNPSSPVASTDPGGVTWGQPSAAVQSAPGPVDDSIDGAGTLTAPAATVVGIGVVAITGSGTLIAAAALAVGTGSVGVTSVDGTGVLTAPAAQAAGDGVVEPQPIIGDGPLTAPAARVIALGTVELPSGQLVAPAARVIGTGTVAQFGIPVRRQPYYLVELISRTPTQSGPPTFEVVAPIAFSALSCMWELSRDGSCDLATQVRQLDPEAKALLADPWRRPSEIQVTRDGQVIWRGPVWTVGIRGETVTIHARGLLAYLRRMVIGPETGDLTFAGVDQHLIAAALIDAWQDLDYGHYGIDTSEVVASGTDRDRTYEATSLKNVYEAVIELGEVEGGFDIEIDPADRQLRLHHPQQGEAQPLYLDARNISSADEQRTAADGRVASVAYVSSSQSDADLDIAVAVDAEALAAHGRAAYAEARTGITVQGTLDGYAQAALDARSMLDWQPAPGLRPVAEFPVDAAAVGDSIEYRYDAGLGLVNEMVRVVRKRIDVTENGSEGLALEVA